MYLPLICYILLFPPYKLSHLYIETFLLTYKQYFDRILIRLYTLLRSICGLLDKAIGGLSNITVTFILSTDDDDNVFCPVLLVSTITIGGLD